jgi:excisionase family DNA binding protein
MKREILLALPLEEFRELLSDVVKENIDGLNKTEEKRIGQEKLMTRSELAKLLGISFPTLGKLIKKGRLPYFRLGRRLYFEFQSVMDYMKKNGGHDK